MAMVLERTEENSNNQEESSQESTEASDEQLNGHAVQIISETGMF